MGILGRPSARATPPAAGWKGDSLMPTAAGHVADNSLPRSVVAGSYPPDSWVMLATAVCDCGGKGDTYRFAPNAQADRFLVTRTGVREAENTLHLVVNWPGELEGP